MNRDAGAMPSIALLSPGSFEFSNLFRCEGVEAVEPIPAVRNGQNVGVWSAYLPVPAISRREANG